MRNTEKYFCEFKIESLLILFNICKKRLESLLKIILLLVWAVCECDFEQKPGNMGPLV